MNYAQYATLFDLLQQTSTTYADAIRITRTDGEVFRFTSHDNDIPVPGDGTYIAANSFTVSALEQEQGFAVSNADFEALVDSDLISESDLANGLFDDAVVEIFVIYWTDVSAGLLPLRYGWMGDVDISNGSFKSEFRGIADRLSQVFTQTLSIECRYSFGKFNADTGIGCHFDLATVQTEHTVASIISPNQIRIDSSVADSAYQWGTIKWLSGNNIGQEMEILQHGGTLLGLFLPPPFEISVGDEVLITKGCDKTIGKCRSYGQILNFGGEPYIRNNDVLQNYPDSKSE